VASEGKVATRDGAGRSRRKRGAAMSRDAAGPTGAGLELELRQDMGGLALMAGELAAFGARHSIADDVVLQMNLALEELVTNIIMHAQETEPAPEIRLHLWVDSGALRAELTDTAAPFDPLSVPPPDLSGAIEERSVGGLGIHLVRSLMDEVTYRRADGRNRTLLVKRLGNRTAKDQDEPPGGR